MDDRKKDGEISVLRTGKGIDKSEIFAYNISVMDPGVAQLVARMVRVHEAVGSNPATRTKNPLKSVISEDFLLLFFNFDPLSDPLRVGLIKMICLQQINLLGKIE